MSYSLWSGMVIGAWDPLPPPVRRVGTGRVCLCSQLTCVPRQFPSAAASSWGLPPTKCKEGGAPRDLVCGRPPPGTLQIHHLMHATQPSSLGLLFVSIPYSDSWLPLCSVLGFLYLLPFFRWHWVFGFLPFFLSFPSLYLVDDLLTLLPSRFFIWFASL